MDITNSWRKTANNLWARGDYLIWIEDAASEYYWGESIKVLSRGHLREGPFPDFLSCAVACELATGGNTSEPLRV